MEGFHQQFNQDIRRNTKFVRFIQHTKQDLSNLIHLCTHSFGKSIIVVKGDPYNYVYSPRQFLCLYHQFELRFTLFYLLERSLL